MSRMNLPQDLQHFPHAALVVTADNVSAKFFIVHEEQLEEFEGISMPHERSTDSEGPWIFDENDKERAHAFVHAIDERIHAIMAEHPVHLVHLVMPAEIEHAVTAHLPAEVTSHIGKKLHVNVMKESHLDVLRRIVAALGTAE